MPARAPRRADPAVEGQRQLGANLATADVASLGCLDEAVASAHEQRLDRGHRGIERAGQMLIGEALELAHQQGRALLIGQARDVLDQAADLLASLSLAERVGQRRDAALERGTAGRRGRTAQLIEAAIVRDAVEPWAQRDRLIACAQAGIRAHQDVLQRILGVVRAASEHLARV